jgi:hypothetical protein
VRERLLDEILEEFDEHAEHGDEAAPHSEPAPRARRVR